MHRPATWLAAGVLAAVVLAGCSLGPGTSGSGEARLTATRDFGAQALLRATEEEVPDGETVLRLLERNAKIETRYGGRFVESIEGVESGTTGGRRDWFYYVNGIEEDVGAAERDVDPNDRVWWDYHRWDAAMRVPAVVGSFPEPFLHGIEGKRFPVRIDCAEDADEACDAVADALERVDVAPSFTAIGSGAGKDVLRLVVGEWDDVRADSASNQLAQGPDRSGVFAHPGPAPAGGYEIDLLNDSGQVVRTGGPGTGLVAATRFEEQQPTWVVTGTDRRGLDAAVRLLTPRALRNRFALASLEGKPEPLPLRPGSGER
jgi:Domain of unknown function (DUF4430)